MPNLQAAFSFSTLIVMDLAYSTEVAFTLHTQLARVRVTAPEFFSDFAMLINSKDGEKA